jgi:ribonuclease R
MAKGGKKHKKHQHTLLLEAVMAFFKSQPTGLHNYKQVCAALGIQDATERLEILELLEALVANGQLAEPETGRFRYLYNGSSYVEGRIELNQRGTGYVVTPDHPEDIFIREGDLKNALDGDTVRVHLFARRKGRKAEGEVVEILHRARTEFVGIVDLSPKFAFVVPSSQRMPIDIFVPLQDLNGARQGEKVVVKMVDWPEHAKNPVGEIVKVLGKPGDNQVEMHAILLEYNLPIEFPEAVEEEANRIPMEIPEAELSKRRDFRNITTFTIDPVDAKDFDDALSIRKLDNGNWEIGVHIADVTHYVKPGSLLEEEAFKRATSVYLVDRVVPMLPEHLSNGVCSLRPNEDKLTYSAVFELNEEAEVQQVWFGKTVIHSVRRFAYEEAQKIIEGEDGDLKAEILQLNALARKLRARRYQRGSIAFDKVEVKFRLDKQGKPLGVFFKVQKEANELIEEFMLLANKSVAEHIGRPPKEKSGKGSGVKPFVYRVHDKPDPEKLNEFARFASQFGYKLKFNNEAQISSSLNELMKQVKGKGEQNVIETLAIRTMAKAIYTTKNIGHYGLAFPFYTHFTSPIRRYPDMMVHRLLFSYMEGLQADREAQLETQCKHSSDMEKLAAEAERASIKYKQVEFLQDKIGEVFQGVISGVTEWGMFVELVENKCEGMIRLRDMHDDFYSFDEQSYSIVGKRSRKRYQLGAEVMVKVKRADLVKKQLDFALYEENLFSAKPEPMQNRSKRNKYRR